MTQEQKIIISKTGEIHGRGSMPHKWVSYLSPEERDHVKNGGIVLIADTNTHPACSGWKIVTYDTEHGYGHREAPSDIAEKATGETC